MNQDEKATSLQSISFSLVRLTLFFYYVLLYKIAWNWFVGDILISINYVDMIFLSLVLNFITLKVSGFRTHRIINEEYGEPSPTDEATSILAGLFGRTVLFGALFIVYLIKSQYMG